MSVAIRVSMPSVLRGYTGGAEQVSATGSSIGALLEDLDQRHPGLRFRMVDETGQLRPHLRVFVNKVAVDGLDAPLTNGDEVQILQRLSGG